MIPDDLNLHMLDDKTLEILDASCSGIIASDLEMVEKNIEQQTHPEQNTTFKCKKCFISFKRKIHLENHEKFFKSYGMSTKYQF